MAQAKRTKRRVTARTTARKAASTRKRISPRHKKSFMGLPGLNGSEGKIFDLLKKGGLTIIGFMVGREIERKVIKDADTDVLLGVHMVGAGVSEMIYGAAVMIEAELRIKDIREIVFPHPTVGEVMRDVMFSL